MNLMLTQAAEVAERLLNIESVSVIGLLLAVVVLLAYYNLKQRADYKELQDAYNKDQRDTRDLLVELTDKYAKDITTVIQMLNTIRDVQARK